MEYLVLLAIPVVSLMAGYIYGKDDINPNTPEGKIYYSKGENT